MPLATQWSDSGLVAKIQAQSLEKLSDENFDVLIRANTGILKGGIIDAARHGILSIHLGDNRVNRGGPPGFWEVLRNESTTGFIIQRLSEELDGGEVLYRGNVATSGFWYLNHAQIAYKAQTFMHHVLKRLDSCGELSATEPPSLHYNPLFTLKGSSLDVFKYIVKVYSPLLVDSAVRIFRGPSVSRWGIAFARYSSLRTSLFRYREIKNPKGRFFADPFVITETGRTICFVEDYYYCDNKGRISAIELNDNGHKFLGTVLEEDFHLSYPFVFRSGTEIYMIPEAGQSDQIRLYKCVSFPLEWQLQSILMDSVRAVDTSIIQVDGIWYMLTNICTSGIGLHGSELHVFYSGNLDSQDWTPLKCGNPVIFDSKRSRNGGLFIEDGRLIRINQVQGKETYGESFCLNEITHLNTEKYAEICIGSVHPNFFPGINRAHHFHTDENFSVVDFARPQRLRARSAHKIET